MQKKPIKNKLNKKNALKNGTIKESCLKNTIIKNRAMANAMAEIIEETRKRFEKGQYYMVCIFIFHDLKSDKWINPFFSLTPADAIRGTINLLKKPGTNISDFPNDFVLYQTGSISEEDGRTISLPDPILIVACSSLKTPEVQN